MNRPTKAFIVGWLINCLTLNEIYDSRTIQGNVNCKISFEKGIFVVAQHLCQLHLATLKHSVQIKQFEWIPTKFEKYFTCKSML